MGKYCQVASLRYKTKFIFHSPGMITIVPGTGLEEQPLILPRRDSNYNCITLRKNW